MAVTKIDYDIPKYFGTLGGAEAGTYSVKLKESGRYFLFPQRTNASNTNYMGLYYVQVYIGSGTQRVNILPIVVPNSGFNNLTGTADASGATLSVTTTSASCYMGIVRMT